VTYALKRGGMKTAVCIQAQDTGRVLFIQEAHRNQQRWTWLETKTHHAWLHTGQIDGLRTRLNRYIDIMDLSIEWFNGRSNLNIVHFRMPEERRVYAPPDEPYKWVHLFEFPDDLPIHPYIKLATSDSLLLDNLVTAAG
jgi:hypothetical protein